MDRIETGLPISCHTLGIFSLFLYGHTDREAAGVYFGVLFGKFQIRLPYLPYPKMKRRSQTQPQRPREPEKKTKEKTGALTLSQLSSDIIWQVGDTL